MDRLTVDLQKNLLRNPFTNNIRFYYTLKIEYLSQKSFGIFKKVHSYKLECDHICRPLTSRHWHLVKNKLLSSVKNCSPNFGREIIALFLTFNSRIVPLNLWFMLQADHKKQKLPPSSENPAFVLQPHWQDYICVCCKEAGRDERPL